MNTCDNTDIPDDEQIIATIRAWVDKVVIGMNLCPFAKAVQVREQVRYVVSRTTTPQALYEDLRQELIFLDKADPQQIDTTVLIHPCVLNDFLDYNAFLDLADSALEELDLEGEIQIASFHPAYQFADTTADDVSNCTNRSPYPILHLLREASIECAVSAIPDAADIYEKNIATMEALGKEGWQQLQQEILSAACTHRTMPKN